ncbi:MAG: amino acid racemase [Woeseiaceae bacterium]|nr:amino acid racemase [Woeseiaceae bacterium]
MDDNTCVAGVLGGLGPAATIDFMRRVLELSDAATEQQHVRLLVDQNPGVPNRQQAILDGGASPGPVLAAMAAGLERAGADFLVMPCNTAHAWTADIVAATSLPFISIVDASVDAILDDVTAIGVLETPACKKAGIYAAALSEAGRDYLQLTDAECRRLMDVAYAVKQGDCGGAQARAARSLAAALAGRGARAIIVACTELPLVLDDDDAEVPLVVSTDALARTTIAIARGEQPLPAPDDSR